MRKGLATLAATLLLVACGGGDDDMAAPSRTVNVDMVDIAFEPSTIKVSAGETVRFVFKNRGTVDHDAFIGDADAQDDHAADMRGGGHHHGGNDDAVTVEPGKTAELTHRFDTPGSFEVGCHQPGHYAGGMKISIEVN